MTTKPTHFIVTYDDGGLIQSNYGWDDECDGAICGGGTVALFLSRRAAQRAIRISAAYAKLCAAQGGIVNEDFTIGLKNVKIVPCSLTRPAK